MAGATGVINDAEPRLSPAPHHLHTPPPHHLATSALHHLTTSPPLHFTTLPHRHLRALPPHYLATFPPCHLATLVPPHHFTASPIHDLTTSPRNHPTTSPPSTWTRSHLIKSPPQSKKRQMRTLCVSKYTQDDVKVKVIDMVCYLIRICGRDYMVTLLNWILRCWRLMLPGHSVVLEGWKHTSFGGQPNNRQTVTVTTLSF